MKKHLIGLVGLLTFFCTSVTLLSCSDSEDTHRSGGSSSSSAASRVKIDMTRTVGTSYSTDLQRLTLKTTVTYGNGGGEKTETLLANSTKSVYFGDLSATCTYSVTWSLPDNVTVSDDQYYEIAEETLSQTMSVLSRAGGTLQSASAKSYTLATVIASGAQLKATYPTTETVTFKVNADGSLSLGK